MPVNMVHIHHEGGGAPCTAAQCDRFSHGGYCYGIGTDTFRRWRSPGENWATADWNHRDLTLCFSGDRHTGYEVTDHDLIVLHNAFMDSYNRGEVTAAPSVVAHRNAGGSNATACPGDRAMRRFNDIVVACRAAGAPGPTPPKPPSGGYPPYPGTPLRNYIEGHGTRTWQQQMKNRGWTIGVDDKYGSQSESVCRAFQQEKHLQVDGIVGPQTWNATWTAPVT